MRLLLWLELLLISLSFYSLSGWGGDGVGETNIVSILVKGLILSLPSLHLLVFLVLGGHIQKRLMLLALSENRYLIAIVLLAFASIAWTPVVNQSLIRAVSLAVASFSIVCLSVFYTISYRESAISKVLNQIQFSFLIAHVVILLAALIYPNIAFTYTDERLGGTIIHPNTLGAFAMISLIVSLFNGMTSRRLNLSSWLTFFLAITILFLSFSRTAMLSASLGVLLLLYIYLGSSVNHMRKLIAKFAMIFGLIIFALICFIKFIDFVEIISRGADFEDLLTGSSRTLIWGSLLGSLGYSFVFGHGYSMLTPSGPLLYDAAFQTFHAHNGYVQLLCGLGVVGLVLFVAQIARYFRRSNLIKKSNRQYSALVSAALFVFVIHNFGQASIGFQIYPQFFFSLLIINVYLLSGITRE